MKRREFLGAAGALAAASGLPLAGRSAAAELDIRQVDLSAGLSRAKFEGLLNETFYIRTPSEGTLLATLARVQGRDGPQRPEQFSLYFRADPLPVLKAGTYEVEHYLAGRIALYLDPLAGGTYRADFSLL